jgi:hypothetical protein
MHKLVIILILPAVDGEIVDWTEKKEAHFVWCKIYYCGKVLAWPQLFTKSGCLSP